MCLWTEVYKRSVLFGFSGSCACVEIRLGKALTVMCTKQEIQ